jgi:hypothetical protein
MPHKYLIMLGLDGSDEPWVGLYGLLLYGRLNRLRKKSISRIGKVGTGFSPYITPAKSFGL